MQLEQTPIEGLLIVHPKVFDDDRGFFFESFNERSFEAIGIRRHWAQDNHARSRKNTLRGLHFQLGPGQAKLARCVAGSVWDVAIDIRPASPTLGRWFGLELTAENKKMFFIPEGFAHGYCVLSDEAEVLYKCSSVYNPALESQIAWNDPQVAVDWPVKTPVLSKRDIAAQSLARHLETLAGHQSK